MASQHGYPIRPFREEDRAAVAAMGLQIIAWWNPYAALHLVAGDPAVAHLQIMDHSSTPTRRPGRLEMRLTVAPEHRRRAIGSRLYERALAFAKERQGRSIRASYVEHTPQDLVKKDPSTIELAEIDGRWADMATSITWGFTGVARAYRGRRIATALKVRAIRAARRRGVPMLETENHADNHPMLAINRKLGYQFGPQEVECIKWLRQGAKETT